MEKAIAQAPETRFGLVRHAQTVWNLEGRIQGHLDSPLTAEGRIQAGAWGKILKPFRWDRIFSSDAKRALCTTEEINAVLKLPLDRDRRLREQDWGLWTGMTAAAVEALYAQAPEGRFGTGWGFCPPGGESRRQLLERGWAALTEAAENHPGAGILVVTHEGMIRCLVNRCLGLGFQPGDPKMLRSGHLHLFICRGGRMEIERLNAADLASSAI